MYLKCHYSTGGAEAVEGKQRFEQFANTHGVKIKAYRADNGIMAKKEYMKSIEIFTFRRTAHTTTHIRAFFSHTTRRTPCITERCYRRTLRRDATGGGQTQIRQGDAKGDRRSNRHIGSSPASITTTQHETTSSHMGFSEKKESGLVN
jgi:hypothetical protein